MAFLKILAIITASYLLLRWLVPKGVFIYEILRLPQWVFKMQSYPRTPHRKSKYAYGKHFRQYLLFYQPENGISDKNQVVIYFHGGGWQFGRPEMFRPNAQKLVEQGYSVFMPSQRRLPFFGIIHQRLDVALSFQKTVEIMRAEGLQDKKILIGGMSSGANLAGLLLFDPKLLATVGLSRELISGAFLLGCPINLDGMWHSPPLFMLAGKRSGKRFPLASPMRYLRPNDQLPLMLMHPEKDGLVEPASVQEFYEKTQTLGMPNVTYHILPDMAHMDAASWCFDNHPSQKIVLDWIGKMETELSKVTPESH